MKRISWEASRKRERSTMIMFKAEFQGDTFTVTSRLDGMYEFEQRSESGEVVNDSVWLTLFDAIDQATLNIQSWAADIDNGVA